MKKGSKKSGRIIRDYFVRILRQERLGDLEGKCSADFPLRKLRLESVMPSSAETWRCWIVLEFVADDKDDEVEKELETVENMKKRKRGLP